MHWCKSIWIRVLFSIYAIGDVIDGPMLAHKAEDEGLISAIEYVWTNMYLFPNGS